MPYKDPERNRAYAKEWRKRFPDRHKRNRTNYKLRSRYDITPEELKDLKILQNNLCLGCYKEVPLCVDHCHETGLVRGLLCRRCNAAIGLAQEDLQILKNLVSYLESRRLGDAEGKGNPSP